MVNRNRTSVSDRYHLSPLTTHHSPFAIRHSQGQAMAEPRSDNPTDLFKLLRGKSPEEAKFFWSGGPVEVAERTWFQSVFSGCTGFETDEGLVLVDSGLLQLGAKLAALLRQKTGAPVHTA